jgi:hypothetical protein
MVQLRYAPRVAPVRPFSKAAVNLRMPIVGAPASLPARQVNQFQVANAVMANCWMDLTAVTQTFRGTHAELP